MTPCGTIDLKSTNYPGMKVSTNSNWILNFHAPDLSDLTWMWGAKRCGRPLGAACQRDKLREACIAHALVEDLGGKVKCGLGLFHRSMRPQIKWRKEESLECTCEDSHVTSGILR